MTVNIPTIKIKDKSVAERPDKKSPDIEIKFMIPVDLTRSKLSRRIVKLIRTGEGIDEEYRGDESSAFYAACLAMIGIFLLSSFPLFN